MDVMDLFAWGIEQTHGFGIFMWHSENYLMLAGFLIIPITVLIALLFVALACVIEGKMAKQIFPDKKKMWIVVITTAITNIIANIFMHTDYHSGPSIFASEAEAEAYAASVGFFGSEYGTFVKLMLITLIVETIVVLVEWVVYRQTRCCKHSFLFSLDANMTSFSAGTLIQLLILMPGQALANPITYYDLSISEIATREDWAYFFYGNRELYSLSVLVCTAMLIFGLLLMLWLQKAETPKEKLNV